MTVTRVFVGDTTYGVSGHALGQAGAFENETGQEDGDRKSLAQLLAAGFSCNNANVHGSNVSGDPTEIALKVAGIKGGEDRRVIHRLVELPFDSMTLHFLPLKQPVAAGRGRPQHRNSLHPNPHPGSSRPFPHRRVSPGMVAAHFAGIFPQPDRG